MDPAGNGTPKPDSIHGMMAAVVEIDSFRLDPNKPFYIKTSRAAVYPSVICMAATDTASNHTKSNFSRKYEDVSSLRYIKPRDHAFDHPNRASRKKRRKKGLISKPGQPAHGEKGVRQYHSRDDSKIPAHRRLGLKDLPELICKMLYTSNEKKLKKMLQ
ncbi:uncharacterized protein LOC127833280 [Dreissena polymorpha]|uniref:uncharacterized protein LOC127833280 n=1 Tax=Dreissena polymorpha TaxID=45954 RepID=UPI0022647E4E|nr:uncharacterized protein LOC127833280 [Dreissena polymorpha]